MLCHAAASWCTPLDLPHAGGLPSCRPLCALTKRTLRRFILLQKVPYNTIGKIESQPIKGQEEFSSE